VDWVARDHRPTVQALYNMTQVLWRRAAATSDQPEAEF